LDFLTQLTNQYIELRNRGTRPCLQLAGSGHLVERGNNGSTLGVGVFSGGGIGGCTLLLEYIAAAVIGSVSLFGGRGSIHAARLGALVIGSVQNELNLIGVENEIRLIVTGLLLVLAVSIDKLIERFSGQQSF
jgi:D-xylose transport system permease protein